MRRYEASHVVVVKLRSRWWEPWRWRQHREWCCNRACQCGECQGRSTCGPMWSTTACHGCHVAGCPSMTGWGIDVCKMGHHLHALRWRCQKTPTLFVCALEPRSILPFQVNCQKFSVFVAWFGFSLGGAGCAFDNCLVFMEVWYYQTFSKREEDARTSIVFRYPWMVALPVRRWTLVCGNTGMAMY